MKMPGFIITDIRRELVPNKICPVCGSFTRYSIADNQEWCNHIGCKLNNIKYPIPVKYKNIKK